MKVIVLTLGFIQVMAGKVSTLCDSPQYFIYSFYNGVPVCPQWETAYFPTQFAQIEPWTITTLPLTDTPTCKLK